MKNKNSHEVNENRRKAKNRAYIKSGSASTRLINFVGAYSAVVVTNAVVGLLVVIAGVVSYRGVRYSDERAYLELGQGIAQAGAYQLGGLATAYRPPAWPILLALGSLVPGRETVVFAIPLVLLIISAILASAIAVNISGQLAGVFASIFVGLYPLNVYTATTLYPQTLALACVLALWCTLLWVRSSSVGTRRPILVGVVAGCLWATLSLAVPTLVITASALLLALVWSLWRNGSPVAAMTSLLAGGGLWMGWIVRNVVTMGEWIPLSTSSGFNLLLGNNGNATGSSGVSADISSVVDAATAAGMRELERNTYYTEQAKLWIYSDPLAATRLYFDKLLNYFAPYNEPHGSVDGSNSQAILAAAAFATIMVFSVYRVCRRSVVPMNGTEWIALCIFFANGPVMALYFTRTRFRQPLDSILAIEAAIGLAIVCMGIARLWKRNRKYVRIEESA